ncbi:molybdopterin-dependent oxidoreductase [Deinococcus deserti]|uniref:Putative Oxidoreductase, molybdopterin binding protein, putative membrane protein n=1 Tax=Deinococcus deserti (strain DSM 17065 / CIP 109153 / LMG 22923 / VCD115) TaxID=546414 RepID=C1CVQ8_DEIDV|nr:molybdopterin-dependent oxidoreductase [Deinococcus deserti]ACO46275.1 putative Oxidoreductase, molybdopterin binding protein, precursor; putative membrane protein [Deinococcus deserti VCD115]
MRFLRAFIAAVALSLLGYLAYLTFPGLGYPPLIVFGKLTQLLGLPVIFQFVHSLFGLGQGGKIFAFTGVVLLWLGGLSLLGGALKPQVAGLVTAVIVVLLTRNWPGVLYGVVYGGLLAALTHLLAPREARRTHHGATDHSRRAATGWLALGSVAVASGGLATLYRGGSQSRTAAVGLKPGSPLPGGVTPVSEWYYVSKNLEAFDPKIKAESWKLQVDGLVRRERSYTLPELQKFEQVTEELTLSCISNPVGGPLMSNGIWQGFRLADLLADVGLDRQARYVLWEAADGYTESLPLGQALERDVLLVTHLNGEPLSPRHGFPLRVLIPGRYGMKQPRWITRIRLSATDKPGYWVKRDWSKTALVELTSRIDYPAETTPVLRADGDTRMRGISFFGSRPVTRVEVSTDGQKTWKEAKLIPPRSKHAWTPWTFDWSPTPGAYEVAVRAWSGTIAQKPEEKDALPEGATGYHHFIVNVS